MVCQDHNVTLWLNLKSPLDELSRPLQDVLAHSGLENRVVPSVILSIAHYNELLSVKVKNLELVLMEVSQSCGDCRIRRKKGAESMSKDGLPSSPRTRKVKEDLRVSKSEKDGPHEASKESHPVFVITAEGPDEVEESGAFGCGVSLVLTSPDDEDAWVMRPELEGFLDEKPVLQTQESVLRLGEARVNSDECK